MAEVADVAALKAEVLRKGLEAQELSAEKGRLVRELGNLRKRAIEADALEEANAQAEADLGEERAKVKTLQAALDNANQRLLQAEQILVAGRQIADGFTQLDRLSK